MTSGFDLVGREARGSLNDIFRITFITNQKVESSLLCADVQQADKKLHEERKRKENRCSLDT